MNDERLLGPVHRSSFIVHRGSTSMRKSLPVIVLLLLASCRTVGVSTMPGGYAEVSPTVANEMIIDSSQIVVIDVRTVDAYHGPNGHIAGALNAPFETIERQLP